MDIKLNKKKYWIPRKYWTLTSGVALFAFLLMYIGLSDISSTLKIKRSDTSVETVIKGNFDDYVSVDGQVVPIQIVQISPEEGGIVLEKVVEEGAGVRKGDVLVRLSNSSLELEILRAESELAEKQNMLRNTQISMEQDKLNNQKELMELSMEEAFKKRAYDTQKALWDEQLNSKEDYLKAKEEYELVVKKNELVRKRLDNSLELRESQMEQMNDNLSSMARNVKMIRERREKLAVKSLIDGEVGFLDVVLGQSITPGQNIGVVNDLSDYKVQAKVDEHYIDRVQPGLKAKFKHGGKSYNLHLRKVYPEVREGRFKVDFNFSGDRPENIRKGQTYYADLQLGQSREAVLIPRGSFYSSTGGRWIYVLDADGDKAYRRNIRIGRQNPRYYEVIEGLSPGEKVIVSGYESYRDAKILKLK